MSGVRLAADRAVQLARNYLEFQAPDARIYDVQAEPRFQHRGVDLLWERPGAPVAGVEVKGDRQARRGNYFFELISNLERSRPGCFLYSMADILLYVFLDRRELHHLPMRETREWFLPRATSFPQKATQTRIGPSRYTTVGAIVPTREVLAAVPGCLRFRIDAEGRVNPVLGRFKR
jgi:hypothetical protein